MNTISIRSAPWKYMVRTSEHVFNRQQVYRHVHFHFCLCFFFHSMCSVVIECAKTKNLTRKLANKNPTVVHLNVPYHFKASIFLCFSRVFCCNTHKKLFCSLFDRFGMVLPLMVKSIPKWIDALQSYMAKWAWIDHFYHEANSIEKTTKYRWSFEPKRTWSRSI